MDSSLVSRWIILFLLLSTTTHAADKTKLGFVYYFLKNDVAPSPQSPQPNNFIVTDFGAIADGITDNSEAFINAWIKACAVEGSVVVVPTGIYLVKSAVFEGPCSGTTSFQVMGTIKASSDSLDREEWIMFCNVDALTINGNGAFDGSGESAWSKQDLRPTSLKLMGITNTTIQDITSINSKFFHVHIHEAENILVQNVNILAPKDSPNTDGIHVGHANNVKIIYSHIATGDDCISIGDKSTNINITGIWCGPGHGISIGSLGRYVKEKDVSEITVKNCTFTETLNGLRIKTWATTKPSITVSNIAFVDINFNNANNPILVDQYYCPHETCSHEGVSNVAIKDLKFINIQGSSASPIAVNLICSQNKPCQDIEFTGLNLTLIDGQPATASCLNADYKFIGSDQVPSTCSPIYANDRNLGDLIIY